MINRIKAMLLSLSAVIMFSLTAAIPATVMAVDCTGGTAVTPGQTNACLCSGSNIDLSGNTQGCDTGSTGIGKLIRTIINVLSVIIGAIAVIMIIIGGFRYIVSAGNPEQAKNARNTILYAIIGLVIVALAQIIVHFVLNNTTNATNP
jgi:cytochrome bd-type quinol oxidase subunit 2